MPINDPDDVVLDRPGGRFVVRDVGEWSSLRAPRSTDLDVSGPGEIVFSLLLNAVLALPGLSVGRRKVGVLRVSPRWHGWTKVVHRERVPVEDLERVRAGLVAQVEAGEFDVPPR